MKRYFILIISICCTIYAHAQQITNYDIIRADIDTLFSKLEKERIPTGLLLDNAISDFNMSILNSNYEIVQNTPFAILYNPNFP